MAPLFKRSLGEPARPFGDHGEVVERVAEALAATAVARDAAGGSALAERQVLRDSGLLNLAVPAEFGGHGEAWPTILRMVRRFAEVDSSLAHLFGFQHLQVATVLLYGSREQQARYLGATVREGWFWGNAVNARDTRLTVQETVNGYVLEGVKAFCSGATDSDALMVSVSRSAADPTRLYAVVPTRRRGITVLNDWDNMGQRQTDSGSVSFDGVKIDRHEVLGPPGGPSTPRASLRSLLAQSILTEIYLGNARGALQEATGYVAAFVQPWPMAGVSQAHDDPVLQLNAGDAWVRLRAACALANDALTQLQAAWELGDELSASQRADVACDIAAARVMAGRVALDVTSQVFELMGARATARRQGLDRFWRNVRVHTLHDPLDHRQRAVGHWALSGEPMVPSSYG